MQKTPRERKRIVIVKNRVERENDEKLTLNRHG